MSISQRANSIVSGTPYVSKRLQENPEDLWELRVFIAPNQLQFLITDNYSSVFYLHPFETMDAGISFFDADIFLRIMDAEDSLKKKFSKVNAGIFSSQSSIVPASVNEENLKPLFADAFQLNHNVGAALQFEPVGELAASVVYPIPIELINTMQQRFPSGTFTHTIAAYLRHFAAWNEGTTLYAILLSGYVQLLCLSGKKLLLSNSFRVKSSDDFIYYVLAVYHTLNLSKDETPLVLYGEIVSDSNLYQSANKYVRTVRPGKAIGHWKFDDDYPFPPHFYSTLYSL
jgi:hypothetical protein